MEKVDVLVVGAGPAGACAARWAAEGGAGVVIVEDHAEVGFPVQCGELVPALRELRGMMPRVKKPEELFAFDDGFVAGRSDTMALVSPGGRRHSFDFETLTLNRRLYDKHLVKLAQEAGAELRLSARALAVEGKRVTTAVGEFEAKVVIGADGPFSVVRRCAGLPKPLLYPCVEYGVAGRFRPEVEMHFGSAAPGGYAWIIPKERSANIGVGVHPRFARGRVEVMLKDFLRRVGAKGKRIYRTGGFVPSSGPLERTVKGNVLLAGDAAGQVMASNGGGIPTAMVAGRAAGRAAAVHIRNGDKLAAYEKNWRSEMGEVLETALSTKRLADRAFGRDWLVELAMFLMPRAMMRRALTCRPLRPWR